MRRERDSKLRKRGWRAHSTLVKLQILDLLVNGECWERWSWLSMFSSAIERLTGCLIEVAEFVLILHSSKLDRHVG